MTKALQRFNKIRAAESRLNRPVEFKLLDESYPEQAKFVLDPALFVCAFTTRRAGKSSGFAYKFFRKAQSYKGSDLMMPYIALTRDSARNIMWPVLQEISRKEGIGAEFKESTLTCRAFGCDIKLFGADMRNFMDRLRGIKTPLATIDEVQGFRGHVGELIDDVLTPAIGDFDDGQLCVAGTPGPVPKGYFYDITTGKGGFSVHTWSAFQNPYIKARRMVDLIMEKKGWSWEHPTIRREWLGEWVADSDALVYKFDDALNRAAALPEGEWTYVIGVDLGYDPDPTAFVVCAYSEHDHNLYVIETYKATKLIISDVVERMRYFERKYEGAITIVDAADKQAVEEMKQRYGIGLIAAEKHGKAGFIELMNSDMRRGLVKVVSGEDLAEEWGNLIWDTESDKRVEDGRYDNHLADACLYAWRYCYNYLASAKEQKMDPRSEAAVDLFYEQEAERLSKGRGILDVF